MKKGKAAEELSSRLRQLLLAEEQRKAQTDSNLEENAEPEARAAQPAGPKGEVGEDAPGPRVVRRRGAGEDGEDGTQDLGCTEREADVESGHRLQEDHAEADAL